MVEHDPEKDKGFRVVDRRRFTSSGDERPDAEPLPAESKAAELPKRAPEPRAQAPRGPGAGRPPEPVPGGVDFLSFAASLATNALAAMGALPEEQGAGLPRSPELAREYIDVLAMLQAKTRGNLTPQEERALQQLITDLRLQFVEMSRRR
jgi:hypothetical protein